MFFWLYKNDIKVNTYSGMYNDIICSKKAIKNICKEQNCFKKCKETGWIKNGYINCDYVYRRLKENKI